MCSIIGYSGKISAAPFLVSGLSKMEYRGYDSVGISTINDGVISIQKDIGKVSSVNESLHLDEMLGNIGIGHTRWATHGTVTAKNAHPHISNSSKISLVHNGIITNYSDLKSELSSKNYEFSSDTDSEVIVNLIEYYFEKSFDPLQAVLESLSRLEGHFSFIVLFSDGTIISVKFHEPLIVGVSSESYYFSSDVLGFINNTDNAIFLENKNVAVCDKTGLSIYDFSGKKISLPITKISTKFSQLNKEHFAHYTIKEINEQTTLCNDSFENEIKQTANLIQTAKNIFVTGSGTSYNAGILAKFVFSKYAQIKLDVLVSSEVSFLSHEISENSVFLAISQSGESADVLSAVSIAKSKKCKIVSIVNNLESSLAKISDITIGIDCGPEIGVAATKSYTAQMLVLYRILSALTKIRIPFQEIPKMIKQIISNDSILEISQQLVSHKDIYILGRGIHYPVSLECALKLKELTYIHAEGMFAGELKHGPLAQIDSSSLVISITPIDDTYSDMLNGISQVHARGAKIVGISQKNHELFDFWIKIPKCDELVLPLLEVIISQLISYHMATSLNYDPDHPQNLAKSVTVR